MDKDIIIIQKIIAEIEIAYKILGDCSMEKFMLDEILKRAISMTIINIGEMAKLISKELRLKNPQIAWKDIAGMRDITAHKYQTLRMEDVFNTVKIDFPILKNQLEQLILV